MRSAVSLLVADGGIKGEENGVAESTGSEITTDDELADSAVSGGRSNALMEKSPGAYFERSSGVLLNKLYCGWFLARLGSSALKIFPMSRSLPT